MTFSAGTGERSLHLVKNKKTYTAQSAGKKYDFKQAQRREGLHRGRLRAMRGNENLCFLCPWESTDLEPGQNKNNSNKFWHWLGKPD
jgi:hypothetical protein